jgi:heme exporter protein A
VHLRGANGAGKTTLLRILAGLSRFGFDGEVQRREPCLFLGHHSAVKGLLTPRENLRWHPAGEDATARRGDRCGAGHRGPVRLRGCARRRSCPPGSSGASTWRGCISARARCGCSMSPSRPSTCRAWRAAAALSEHAPAGGAVLLTSHQSLDVDAPVRVVDLLRPVIARERSGPGRSRSTPALLRRQLALALRRPVQLLNPLLFFAMVIVLFPLGLGPAPDTLSEFAGGHPVDRGAAGEHARREKPVSQRLRGRLPGSAAAGAAAAVLRGAAYLLVHWLLTGVLLAPAVAAVRADARACPAGVGAGAVTAARVSGS